MAHRYEDIYSELLETVPELGLDAWPPEEPPDWEFAMQRAGQSLTQEDRAYLLSVEANHPHPEKVKEPPLYIIFEDQLRRLLVSCVQQPEKHARLAIIMDWLEELARTGDEKTTTLVAIAICEGFITNDNATFPQLLPFMGAAMLQMCRDFIPFFRVNEEIKTLLASSK